MLATSQLDCRIFQTAMFVCLEQISLLFHVFRTQLELTDQAQCSYAYISIASNNSNDEEQVTDCRLHKAVIKQC